MAKLVDRWTAAKEAAPKIGAPGAPAGAVPA